MASIEKRSSDKWRVCVYLGESLTGQKLKKSFTYTVNHELTEKQNEKAAHKAAAEFERKLNNGTIDGDKTTLQSFGEKWLASYVKTELEAQTYARYKEALHHVVYPRIGMLKLSDIRPLTIQNFLNSMRTEGYSYKGRTGVYSEESIRTVKIILSSLLSFAVDEGLIDRNPCTASRQRKHKKVQRKEVKSLTVEQIDNLLKALETPFPVVCKSRKNKIHGKVTPIKEHINRYNVCDLQFRALVTLAVFSGMRRGELIALNWSDFDFKKMTVTVDEAAAYTPETGNIIKTPKTASGFRTITLPPVVIDLMKQLKADHHKTMMKMGTAWEGIRDMKNAPCFIQRNGERMSVQTPTVKLKKLIQTYNVNRPKGTKALPEVGLHALRHTMASLLIAGGADAASVASRLGHADCSTTWRVYVHAFETADKKAADILEETICAKQA